MSPARSASGARLENQVARLLRQVREGKVSIADAVERLRSLPFEDLGFAKVDHHRALRTGFPEVIYCSGKTPEQVVAIAQRIRARGHIVLATRCSEAVCEALSEAFPEAAHHHQARITVVGKPRRPSPRAKPVAVLTAGTADVPVAEEAAVTAETLGCRVERVYDVGVAGIHRLLGHLDLLNRARVIVVVAGMEGALPSVVGGLVSVPVIAVPTSVGYGASFEGLSALLTMLNSCAAGIAVVNIDNGFGAGYFAALLMRKDRAR